MPQERRSGIFAAGEIGRVEGGDSIAGAFAGARPIGQPASIWEAFEANRRNQTGTINHNVREFQTQDALWERHRQIEAALGRDLPLAQSLTGEPTERRDSLQRTLDDLIPADRINAWILGRPGTLTDDAYEAMIEDLRSQEPEALEGIETRAALQARLEARWFALRARADETAASGPEGAVGAFLGATVGALQDPPTAAVTLATGGAGASRPLLQRMLVQGAIGAGFELTEAPDRAADAATFGGPEYGLGDAAADVFFGAVGPAAFEAGGAGLRVATRPARRALGLHADPVVRAFEAELLRSSRAYARGDGASIPLLRGVGHQVDRFDRDDAALGRHAGDVLSDARSALDRGSGFTPLPLADLDENIGTGVPFGEGLELQVGGRRVLVQDMPANFSAPAIPIDDLPLAARTALDGPGSAIIAFEGRAGELQTIGGGRMRALPQASEQATAARQQAYVFRQADGWSLAEARAIAAIRGMRDGGSDALELARVVRELSRDVDIDALPVGGALAEEARGLARLSPEAFSMVERGEASPAFGAMVGQMTAGADYFQGEMLAVLKAAGPADLDEGRLIVRDALSERRDYAYGLIDDLTPPAGLVRRARLIQAVVKGMGARLGGLAELSDAGGFGLGRTSQDAAASRQLAAASVVDRVLLASPEGRTLRDGLGSLSEAEIEAGGRLVARALNDAGAAHELRGERLAPRSPSPVAREAAGRFMDPGGVGQRAQLSAKPEDLEAETHPDWDDLREGGDEKRALDALRQCAPGGGL